jgi:hypothetical protein
MQSGADHLANGAKSHRHENVSSPKCIEPYAGLEEVTMKTNTTKLTLISATIALTAMAASFAAANAGGPPHKLPADSERSAAVYDIKVVGIPSVGHPLIVQVVKKATGEAVTNADVSMQHWVWAGMKAVPQSRFVLVPLDTDGYGDYVCGREHLRPGDRVVIHAHVPGDASGTWATVALDN